MYIYTCYLQCTFVADSKPTIKQLKKWVIPRVGHKWHNLGFQLLDHVKAKRLSTSKGGNQKCCLEVLRVWLDGNPDTNWYPLVEALESKSVQLNEVAGDIRNMFTGTYMNFMVTFTKYKICNCLGENLYLEKQTILVTKSQPQLGIGLVC